MEVKETKGVLVIVEKAEDLIAKNRRGMTSNPFFKIGIAASEGSGFEDQYCTSDIIVHSICPKWLKNNVFKLQSENILSKYILMEIYHSGHIKATLLGKVYIKIGEIKNDAEIRGYELETSEGKRGRIYLNVSTLYYKQNDDEGEENAQSNRRALFSTVKRRMTKNKAIISHKHSLALSIVNGRIEQFKVSKMSEDKLSEHFEAKEVSALRPHFRTGDILLFSGTEAFSKLIKLATFTTWSHVCMVVREPSERVREAFQLEHFGDENIYVYESDTETWDKREGGGVQMTGLTAYVNSLAAEYNTDRKNFLFVVRHLSLPEPINSLPDREKFEGLEEFLLMTVGKKYESDKKALVKVAIRKNKGDHEEYFCSELIADAYKRMGLLCSAIVSDNYLPKDFSSAERSRDLNLLRGATLSKEIRILSPPQSTSSAPSLPNPDAAPPLQQTSVKIQSSSMSHLPSSVPSSLGDSLYHSNS